MSKELKEILAWMDYDESVIGSLVWKYHPRKGRIGKRVVYIGKGKEVPSFSYNGVVSSITAKKLLWIYVNGEVGAFDSVEVLDGDESNVTIENLYLVTHEDKLSTTEMIKRSFLNKRWSDIFYYSEGELYWKVSLYRGHTLRNRVIKEDDLVTTSEDLGGYRLLISGISFGFSSRHSRIVYELLNNTTIPEGKEVDHINGIRTDDRIENLRLVDRQVNARNKKRYKTNKSGISGVSFSKSKNSYVAFVMSSPNKKEVRSFSIKKYGKNLAQELAKQWRQTEIEKLNLQYGENGYTARHGL